MREVVLILSIMVCGLEQRIVGGSLIYLAWYLAGNARTSNVKTAMPSTRPGTDDQTHFRGVSARRYGREAM